MAELYIFDPDDTLITILSNEGEEACPFWDAPFREELNQGSTFQFTAQGDHPDSKHLKAENQVAFKDKDGDFRLFVIKEPEKMDSEDGPVITCVCEPAMLELNDDMVYDENNAKEIYELAPKNVTLKTVVTRILKHTRWEVGEIAELGLNTTHFFYLNATEALMKAINTWGGEFRDRVTVEGSTITGRYIDILPRRGADTGKRWEMDKDILSIRHQVQSYPKTALIGRGAGLAITDEKGEETGGYSRKISFADVEWKKENGDPADKPKGQKWVGDLRALALFGRKDADGSRRHRIGIYETDTEDPSELLRETWEALQSQKNQLSNFELDVFLLEEITGYEHEKVRLGDTSFSIDRRFAEPIEAEERVIVFEYDVSSPDETGKVEMGQFIDLYADDKRLDDIEAIIKEKGPQWDNGGKRPITDDKIENVTPTQPKNVIATGLFQSVLVEWDFVGTIAIQHYEVYASQIQGFTPDASNLVFRGKTSVYTFKAETNQQWYFRVRAVNTHDVPGPFSEEASANTARIITDDILFGAVNAEILADLAVEAAKLDNQAVEAEKIANAAVGNAAIQNLAVTNSKIENLAVGEAQIENLAITNAKIANLAVDDAKISSLSVSKLKAGTLDASKITIFGGSTTDYTRIEGSTIWNHGRYLRTWNGVTRTIDSTIQIKDGYLRFVDTDDGKALGYSVNGISTYLNGTGENNASGTINFFDTYNYDQAGLGLYSRFGDISLVTLPSSGRNINIHSRYSTDIKAGASVSIKSEGSFIYLTPKSNQTGQTFRLDVENSNNRGDFMYGAESAGFASGIRFKGDGVEVRGRGNEGFGSLDASSLTASMLNIWDISAVDANVRVGVSNQFQVKDKRFDGWANAQALDWKVASSVTLKTNVKPLGDKGLQTIRSLQPVSYNYTQELEKGNYNKTVGFLAEMSPDIADEDCKSISSIKLSTYNTLAIKELDEKVTNTEKETKNIYEVLNILIDENEELRKKVSDLESR